MTLFNRLLVSSLPAIPKPIVGWVASRYIAGAALEDALNVTRNLNKQGVMSTIDLLGEDVTDRSQAAAAREGCKEVLRAVHREGLNANLSLKPTELGLKLDRKLCEDNLSEILQAARETKNFVRIDMEDHTCTDATLEIYDCMRKKFENVGVAIQAYLRRSESDVRALVRQKVNIRLCKGIYIEPESIAFKKKEEIRRNFLNLLRIILSAGMYVGIATHDDPLIDGARRIVAEMKIPNDRYEFQSLLGVKPSLRRQLVRAGYRVRVYVPFGKDWYPYAVRRLKENPNIASQALASILTRDTAK
jgi:proline dehydrogenase